MAGFQRPIGIALLMIWAMAAPCTAAILDDDPAAALRAQYSTLGEKLSNGPLGPGLYLKSVETPREAQGDLYAIVDYAFANASNALRRPESWCDILILHLNIKYCHVERRESGNNLTLAIGRKFDQPLSSAYRVDFDFSISASHSDYLLANLNATKGPFGTRNYRIAFEMIALGSGQAGLHVKYSYQYDQLSRLAMQTYLATSGRDKVGFTMVGDGNSNRPHYVGGERGAVERNVMRYYLSIDAYLGSLPTPPPQRLENALNRWFTSTEHYAQQLHEMDRDTYVNMKRREYARQQTTP